MNWKSYVLGGIGVFIFVFFFMWYLFIWNDTSQGLNFMIGGTGFILIAILYEFIVQMRKEIKDLRDRFEYVEDRIKEEFLNKAKRRR